ncbi:methyltransferase family protein [Sulfurimonas autotrophica]|uniref:Isoprenylcysteine carboxyl methyltransferase n=1 Tax=Sulfurimonas autotrophica (strain ATCC BAA-671 / DSM 16294 / JCM 11897 / OK10) TaxID=563040 RepID=E0UST8_SULAO|nr:methyltransferase [Sulfurimonas autotrophica]ADN08115.1 Isoprenylcysteine carboxyl methyltransferase [Sulfurimonas autotrophica DSM 16294]
MKSKILVGLQFFIIFLMILPLGTKTQHLYLGSLILIFGIIIGLLALKEHKSGNFNIRPDIKENCELVTSGIYTYVRHPMYLSVLLSMFGLAVIYFTYYEFALLVILLITLLVKLFYEESLWKCHNPAYIEYLQKTKRLLPFVF